MYTGMMWRLNSDTKSTLEQKIREAIDYYHKKYGRLPELCLMHPSTMESQSLVNIEHVTIRLYRPVLPHHVWVGFEDKPTKETSEK